MNEECEGCFELCVLREGRCAWCRDELGEVTKTDAVKKADMMLESDEMFEALITGSSINHLTDIADRYLHNCGSFWVDQHHKDWCEIFEERIAERVKDGIALETNYRRALEVMLHGYIVKVARGWARPQFHGIKSDGTPVMTYKGGEDVYTSVVPYSLTSPYTYTITGKKLNEQ